MMISDISDMYCLHLLIFKQQLLRTNYQKTVFIMNTMNIIISVNNIYQELHIRYSFTIKEDV